MSVFYKKVYIAASLIIAVIISSWLSALYIEVIFNARAKFNHDAVDQLYFDMSAFDIDSLLNGVNAGDFDAYKDQNLLFKRYSDDKGGYQYFVFDGHSGELELNKLLHVKDVHWLAPYSMLLSNNLVSSIYLISDDDKVIGLTESLLSVPANLYPSNTELQKNNYRKHFYACLDSDPSSECNFNPYVTDEFTDKFSNDSVITLVFPYELTGQRFGLISVDMRLRALFGEVFYVHDSIKPTDVNITSMKGACGEYNFCLSKEVSLLGAKTFNIAWRYSYVDFIMAIVSTARFIYSLLSILILMSAVYFMISVWSDRQSRDSLTGAYSRRAINNIRHHSQYLYVLILDVDNFKTINDTYGHDLGDKVLVALVNHLKKHTRKDDIICRWGGEEFVLLYRTGVAENDMLDIVRRLWSSPVTIPSVELNVTFSGGLVRMGDDISNTVNAADKLLYQVKQNGKNNVMQAINGEPTLLMAKPLYGSPVCTDIHAACSAARSARCLQPERAA
ncbi:GGDEF domain-containing protein [Aeromonas sp.]|uniref:GGDEF domain-containing protein n=1 Tax=Aeromonas sp. TaxID=647 RepID=UPI00290833DE|nr:GGDEF domain-containing protein [Aeromonas sp.]MDU7579545.1 GGDEF domain-containing protein [Aeromonas sp.]